MAVPSILGVSDATLGVALAVAWVIVLQILTAFR